jgi:hypothetical protein
MLNSRKNISSIFALDFHKGGKTNEIIPADIKNHNASGMAADNLQLRLLDAARRMGRYKTCFILYPVLGSQRCMDIGNKGQSYR